MNKDDVIVMQDVFGSPKGKKVLEILESICYVNGTVYHDSPHLMGLREGRRTVLLDIKRVLSTDVNAVDIEKGTLKEEFFN